MLMAQFDATFRRVSGLPMQWVEILIRLERSPDRRLRLNELAGQVGLSPSGLSRAISRLEERDLITRVDCTDDRRGCFAVLTPAGHELMNASLMHHVRDLDQFFFQPLADEDLATFVSACRKLRDTLDVNAELRPHVAG